ncbi:MAG TPA: M28 family peptidase, partial [Blastocatellia bacterium]|nr:M28 family peptidase [Blastocatellia bacterium]
NRAPRVVERIWQAAERVGADAFSHRSGNKILDDQTAFLDRGIPVALLIDFDYPFHHTLDDTLDKCSADSLGQVGKVVMDAIEQHMQH